MESSESGVLYELERVLSLASPSDSFQVNVFEWEIGDGDWRGRARHGSQVRGHSSARSGIVRATA